MFFLHLCSSSYFSVLFCTVLSPFLFCFVWWPFFSRDLSPHPSLFPARSLSPPAPLLSSSLSLSSLFACFLLLFLLPFLVQYSFFFSLFLLLLLLFYFLLSTGGLLRFLLLCFLACPVIFHASSLQVFMVFCFWRSTPTSVSPHQTLW